jgi:hypothetical protein
MAAFVATPEGAMGPTLADLVRLPIDVVILGVPAHRTVFTWNWQRRGRRDLGVEPVGLGCWFVSHGNHDRTETSLRDDPQRHE